MTARLAERAAALLPLAGLVVCCVIFLFEPQTLTLTRYAFFDQLQRWHPRPVETSPRVAIIDIDDESLQRLGQWPWPRSRLAELVRRLRSAGASVIGFDMMFSEPDRSSPRAVVDIWPLDAEQRRMIASLPDHDAQLATALAGDDVVLGYAVRDTPGESSALPPKFGISTRGEIGDGALFEFDGRLASLPILEQAAAGVGHVSVIEDADGVVRKLPVMMRVAGAYAPALVMEALRVDSGTRSYLLDAAPDGAGLEAVVTGGRRVLADEFGQAWVHYGRFRPERYQSAWRLLEGDSAPDPSRYRDHIVLVGGSAALLHDLRTTPLRESVPGVEIHRQMIEQVVSGHSLRRPGWIVAIEALALLVGSLLASALAWRLRSALAAPALVAMLVAAVLAARHFFSVQGLLIDAVAPALAWTTCFVLASLARLYRSERRQRWIRSAFSRYVSPNLVRHLVANPTALELGGRRQMCSFVFTDLEGFTPLIEKTPPKQAVALINEYLDDMIAIVFAHDGTLIRIVGDALAVMFSAPVEQADHASRALRCARALDRRACEFAASHSGGDGAFCRTRIGVHSGEVTVGNFGGSAMLDYRALGDPINVAARLEAANKRLGTRVCVSAATLAEVPNTDVRPIGRLRLRGKRESVTAFEPLTAPDPDYDAAFALLREESPSAMQAFEELCAARTDDPLVSLHLGRLRAGENGDQIDLT